MYKMPKKFNETVIAQLLGPKALERLRVAYLRNKAANITPVTAEDVKTTLKYIEEMKGGVGASQAFRRVAFKWVTESKWAHRSFLRYIGELNKAAEKTEKHTKKKEVKHGKN
jgi:hypothetical protein